MKNQYQISKQAKENFAYSVNQYAIANAGARIKDNHIEIHDRDSLTDALSFIAPYVHRKEIPGASYSNYSEKYNELIENIVGIKSGKLKTMTAEFILIFMNTFDRLTIHEFRTPDQYNTTMQTMIVYIDKIQEMLTEAVAQIEKEEYAKRPEMKIGNIITNEKKIII